MASRYIFGPVSKVFADQNLRGPRERGECLVFDGDGELAVGPNDSWQTIASGFPTGWRPDYLVLFLQYRIIPPALWNAPIPIIGLAGDWNLLFHNYRQLVSRCDLVFTDTLGAQTFTKAGLSHVRPGILFGYERRFIEEPTAEFERSIDILFVGNFLPAIQGELLPWLARVGQFSANWNVHFATEVFGENYQRLLRQSRIVFNRSIRQECNNRVGEAIASGALLFQEADNFEVPILLQDRRECVLYTSDNLEELLTYYLENEGERHAIAQAARRRALELSFERQWAALVSEIESDLSQLWEKVDRRISSNCALSFSERVWQQNSATIGTDTTLVKDLGGALEEGPNHSALLNLQGFAFYGANSSNLDMAANAFQGAWTIDPRNFVAGLNLTEMLVMMGQKQHAIEQARRTLALLDRLPFSAEFLNAPHVPSGFSLFRILWEQAAWVNAGQPTQEVVAKQCLIRWRLHQLLGELTDDLIHYFHFLAARPDQAISQALVGFALGRANRPADAMPYIWEAYQKNPFDQESARAYFHVLGQLGLTADQQRVIRERQNLAKAAPQLVPTEPWFAATSPATIRSSKVAPLRIVWQGAQQVIHSLALVNREICSRLIRNGHELSLVPPTNHEPLDEAFVLAAPLKASLGKHLSGPADIHISHQWPPDFQKPRADRWVIIQPWEFGSLPRSWIAPLTHDVDEIWVPSNFVRNCYVTSGVPAEKVHVVPNGVAPIFFQEHSPLPLKTTKGFRFLFVGGTIERKGIDLLLKTYHQVFSSKDDVCLVIKAMGGATFYQGQSVADTLAQYQQQANAPKVEYLTEELSTEQLASLYAACDCLVHPYRGEGFGLPIAEAMASRLPVVVTGLGAALDFCRAEHAYLIPARMDFFTSKRIGDLETVDFPWWAEPNHDSLRLLLRHVFENREEAIAKGRKAHDFIQSGFTWEHTVSAVEERLEQIVSQSHVAPVFYSRSARTEARSPTVSLNIIVKNEEPNLPACLDSVADLVDEVVIVDTGSTDGTVRLAKSRGAKVVYFPWVDSFAAARNEALRHATGDWIFWMDADDRVDQVNRPKLRTLFADLPSELGGFVMKCLCVPDPETGTGTVVDHVRLFSNHPKLRWKYRIHEQILVNLRQLGGNVRWSDVIIYHVGYQDKAVRLQKLERDHRLLLLEDHENPDDPFTLFNLGSTYLEQKLPDKALGFLGRSLARSKPTDSIVRKLYSMLAQCHRLLGNPEKSKSTCHEGRKYYPHDPEILFQESLTLQKMGDREGAISCLLHLVENQDGVYFASVDTGIRGCKSHHNLAVLYLETGQWDNAERQWQMAIEKEPEYLPSFIGLADFYLKRSRRDDFLSIVQKVENHPHGKLDGQLLRARVLFYDEQFEAARHAVNRIIQSAPNFLPARIILSHILLREGRDRNEAEKALREVLERDPQNVETRQNLEILLKQVRFK